MKGVFEISGVSRYKDQIEVHYHFPRIYLRNAERCLGDLILYRETGAAGGRKAYVAVARLVSIDPDADEAGHYYGRVSDFLPFDQPVPYRDPSGRFAEQFLREIDPATVGRALRGRSVRPIEQRISPRSSSKA